MLAETMKSTMAARTSAGVQALSVFTMYAASVGNNAVKDGLCTVISIKNTEVITSHKSSTIG
jgi:hypothetical protein